LFRLHLAAERKAGKTVRTYTEAMQWFAAHLWREARVVKVSFDAARSLDRYLRVRARHVQASRPQLWLGVNNRGPMTASGIYQVTVRRGRQCGIEVFPHRFRHHFSHTWLDRGGAEGDLMELNGWTSPQMLRRYGASARSARARRSYDRVMEDAP
jgi:integrase